MVGSVFEGGTVIGASFQGCDLRGMRAVESIALSESWGGFLDQDGLFVGVKVGWSIDSPQFKNVNFAQADMRHSVMHGVDLQGSDFSAADLRHAKITLETTSNVYNPASMIGADLREAVLLGEGWDKCKFYGARFEGADLGEIKLDMSSCIGITWDGKTRFPPGFEPPPSSSFALTRSGALRLALIVSLANATNLVAEVNAFVRYAATNSTLAAPRQ
jgi:uncharacterized protein YjbI with pentapeptide repeats